MRATGTGITGGDPMLDFEKTLEAIIALKTKPATINAIPTYKQFFAFFGSSFRKIKYAIIPPIIPKNIGNKNHRLLLVLSG